MQQPPSTATAAFEAARVHAAARAAGMDRADADAVAGALAAAWGGMDRTAQAGALVGALPGPLGTLPPALAALPSWTRVAAWPSCAEAGFAAVTFSRESALAAARRGLDEGGTRCFGLDLPEDVAERLEIAAARPGCARAFFRTAADRMALHVLEAVGSLPGSAPRPDGGCDWLGAAPAAGFGDLVAWLEPPGPGCFASSVFLAVPAGYGA